MDSGRHLAISSSARLLLGCSSCMVIACQRFAACRRLGDDYAASKARADIVAVCLNRRFEWTCLVSIDVSVGAFV